MPAEASHRTIGLHLDQAFVRLAGERHAGRRDDFKRHFGRRADQVMNEMTVLFETVPEAVRRLQGEGKKLAIVSTKYRSRISEFLQREGLLEAFEVIVGGEDVLRHKPDPEGLQLAVERLGCRLQDALYVGDSVVDAEAAQQAGVSFAAVLSGVTRREEFDAFPSAAVVENLRQLTD